MGEMSKSEKGDIQIFTVFYEKLIRSSTLGKRKKKLCLL